MALFYAFTDGSPNGPVYEIEVNKGDMRVQQFTKTANARWANGYFIEHLIEQHGNTVVVWRKREPQAQPQSAQPQSGWGQPPEPQQ